MAILVLVGDVADQDEQRRRRVASRHRRLNYGKLNLYQLVSLLKQEATLGDVEVKLMSGGVAVRVQRSK